MRRKDGTYSHETAAAAAAAAAAVGAGGATTTAASSGKVYVRGASAPASAPASVAASAGGPAYRSRWVLKRVLRPKVPLGALVTATKFSRKTAPAAPALTAAPARRLTVGARRVGVGAAKRRKGRASAGKVWKRAAKAQAGLEDALLGLGYRVTKAGRTLKLTRYDSRSVSRKLPLTHFPFGLPFPPLPACADDIATPGCLAAACFGPAGSGGGSSSPAALPRAPSSSGPSGAVRAISATGSTTSSKWRISTWRLRAFVALALLRSCLRWYQAMEPARLFLPPLSFPLPRTSC